MKKTMLALVGVIGLVFNLHARLGETKEECVKRYGNIIKTIDKDRLYFIKAGFEIIITFKRTNATSVMFRKQETDAIGNHKAMSDTEMQTLLKANGNGSSWKEKKAIIFGKKFWKTDDGKKLACYYSIQHNLIITTKDKLQSLDKAKKEKEQRNLENF